VLRHGVGLDDGEGAFDSHLEFFLSLKFLGFRRLRKFGKALNFSWSRVINDFGFASMTNDAGSFVMRFKAQRRAQ
ncbi:MAG TPA: hypothetical protein VNN06_02155, partial [Ramlibacter sp.]|nr:hypothetical protein [Ramlibacter sp.]